MNDLHKKLVDMYAGRELPAELEEGLEMDAFNDAELSHDMATLRKTVEVLRAEQPVAFTEESYQRVLMKLYARAGDVEPQLPAPLHLQYQLPIQG